MPDVLTIFGQYGLPGLVVGAQFYWIWRTENAHTAKTKAAEEAHALERAEWQKAHAQERAELQAQLKAIREQHRDDLKEGNKNAIALLADVHDVVERLGGYAESVAVSQEPPRGPVPRRLR